MRRITIWLMSTLSALVLLFSYSTSTNAKSSTSIVASSEGSVNESSGTASSSDTEGRAIVNERYKIPAEVREARRSISRAHIAKRRDERVNKGVVQRSETSPAPTPS